MTGRIATIPLSLPKVTPERLRVLSLLNVTSVMQPAGDEIAIFVDGLPLRYDGPDARVYENRRALPRAWVVGGQRVVDGGDAALDAVGDASWRPRREAIVEEEIQQLDGRGGVARIVDYGDEDVEIEATSRGRGLLVLSDLHYPGWRARVDGEEVDVERVNYVM